MENLINKYQNQLTTTTQALEELENAYQSQSSDNEFGMVITKQFFEKMSLGYSVEIDIYKNIIKDLEISK